MFDITLLMVKYKNAIRHIWNTYCLDNDYNYESSDIFADIKINMFLAMVLRPLNIEHLINDYMENNCMPYIKVVPVVSSKVMLISPERYHLVKGNKSYYSTMIGPSMIVNASKETVFDFCDFFDFNSLGHVDFNYIQCVVRNLMCAPELTGKFVYIPQEYCRFNYDANQIDRLRVSTVNNNPSFLGPDKLFP